MPGPAFVVFSGETEIRWLKFCLKPGFRHCFLIFQDLGQWVSFDPLAHRTEIRVHADLPEDFDLPGWLVEGGHVLVRTQFFEPPARPAPFMPITCVESVKRVLGLHRRRILTPWQLYRYLSSAAASAP